jgi:uroporphyrinogen decarboxylase
VNHRARLEAALSGARPDRPPLAFWRHFPVDDQTPDGLAAAHANFQRTYDLDLVKLTPESGYCLKDWGLEDVWLGATEGTRVVTRRPLIAPEDWARLPLLDPTAGQLGRALAAMRLLTTALGPETPVLMTIFNPLSQARKLIGPEQMLVHLRRHPEELHAALRTITETTRRFIEAASATGIAGIFYAVQHAQYGLLSDQEFAEFGRPYDLQVLEVARPLWLNMLHLHGLDVMFEAVADYPVQIINWHDQETPPDLAEGQRQFGGIVCGGIRREETMVLGDPAQVVAEAAAARDATGGTRFLLGTGCVIPITTPHGNLLAARRWVDA